jgi:thermolysin
MPRPSRDQQRAFENLKKVDANAEVVWDERSGTPIRLRGNLTAPGEGEPEGIARQFISANNRLFAMKAPEKELRLKVSCCHLAGDANENTILVEKILRMG